MGLKDKLTDPQMQAYLGTSITYLYRRRSGEYLEDRKKYVP
jgi:hypothetical protein